MLKNRKIEFLDKLMLQIASIIITYIFSVLLLTDVYFFSRTVHENWFPPSSGRGVGCYFTLFFVIDLLFIITIIILLF